LEKERVRIAGLVSQAHTAAEQKRRLQVVGAAGLGLGLFLFPVIAAFAPGGSYLSAWTRGTLDRWQAGVDLLSAANPSGVAELSRVWKVAQENRETLDRCVETAGRSKQPQACTITVPVMPPLAVFGLNDSLTEHSKFLSLPFGANETLFASASAEDRGIRGRSVVEWAHGDRSRQDRRGGSRPDVADAAR
jgi:hypothetical protein